MSIYTAGKAYSATYFALTSEEGYDFGQLFAALTLPKIFSKEKEDWRDAFKNDAEMLATIDQLNSMWYDPKVTRHRVTRQWLTPRAIQKSTNCSVATASYLHYLYAGSGVAGWDKTMKLAVPTGLVGEQVLTTDQLIDLALALHFYENVFEPTLKKTIALGRSIVAAGDSKERENKWYYGDDTLSVLAASFASMLAEFRRQLSLVGTMSFSYDKAHYLNAIQAAVAIQLVDLPDNKALRDDYATYSDVVKPLLEIGNLAADLVSKDKNDLVKLAKQTPRIPALRDFSSALKCLDRSQGVCQRTTGLEFVSKHMPLSTLEKNRGIIAIDFAHSNKPIGQAAEFIAGLHGEEAITSPAFSARFASRATAVLDKTLSLVEEFHESLYPAAAENTALVSSLVKDLTAKVSSLPDAVKYDLFISTSGTRIVPAGKDDRVKFEFNDTDWSLVSRALRAPKLQRLTRVGSSSSLDVAALVALTTTTIRDFDCPDTTVLGPVSTIAQRGLVYEPTGFEAMLTKENGVSIVNLGSDLYADIYLPQLISSQAEVDSDGGLSSLVKIHLADIYEYLDFSKSKFYFFKDLQVEARLGRLNEELAIVKRLSTEGQISFGDFAYKFATDLCAVARADFMKFVLAVYASYDVDMRLYKMSFSAGRRLNLAASASCLAIYLSLVRVASESAYQMASSLITMADEYSKPLNMDFRNQGSINI